MHEPSLNNLYIDNICKARRNPCGLRHGRFCICGLISYQYFTKGPSVLSILVKCTKITGFLYEGTVIIIIIIIIITLFNEGNI